MDDGDMSHDDGTWGATPPVRWTEDGVVAIGVRPAAEAAVQAVEALGATILVDVARPADLPYCEIADFELAAWWLDMVYGEDNVLAIGEVCRGEEATAALSGAWRTSELRVTVNRLAVGMWIQRWWPQSDQDVLVEDEVLLDLEVGVLAWACEHLLGGLGLAESYLGPRATAVATLAPDIPGHRDDDLLLPVIRATVESVPLPDDVVAALRRAEDRREVAAAGGVAEGAEAIARTAAASAPTAFREDASETLAYRGSRGLTRGFRPGTPKWDEEDLDLTLVAPRSVAGTTFQRRIDGTGPVRLVHVKVQAGQRTPASEREELWARVYDGRLGLPVAIFPLQPAPGPGGGWSASSDEIAATGNELLVEVFSPGYLAAPDPARHGLVQALVVAGVQAVKRRLVDLPGDAPPDVVVQELDWSDGWRGLAVRA